MNAADDEITVKQRSTTKISTNSNSRTRPDPKQSSSSSLKSSSPHQQLLAQFVRLEQQKKTTKPILATSSQSIVDLLKSPKNDLYEQQKKRLKTSHRPSTQTDKLIQLLLSPPNNSSSAPVHNFGTSSSIFDRLPAENVISAAPSPSQTGRRRSKQQRNLLSQDLLLTSDRTSDDVTSLKAQLLEVARKLQQKEDLETQSVMNTDVTSNGLTNPDENRLDDSMMNVDDGESTDPWRFRPKTGCRYVKVKTLIKSIFIDKIKKRFCFSFVFQPIDSDCQEQNRTNRSAFTSFYQIHCSERGHLGRRRVRVGRGGR